jgi:hypothetical protein
MIVVSEMSTPVLQKICRDSNQKTKVPAVDPTCQRSLDSIVGGHLRWRMHAAKATDAGRINC